MAPEEHIAKLEAGFRELLDLLRYRTQGTYTTHYDAKVSAIVERVLPNEKEKNNRS